MRARSRRPSATGLADVPIFTSTVGSQDQQPDVALEPVEPPAFAIVGRRLEIPVSLESAMPREVPARISLAGPDGLVESRGIALPARRITTEILEFLPTVPGRVSLTITVDPVPGELDLENNTRTIELDVREESLDVLLVESFPRWEYRYLRNALVRDPGVEVDCYLTLPGMPTRGGGPHYLEAFPSKELLGEYDVIFIGDVGLGPDGLTLEQCENIAGVVRDQGGGADPHAWLWWWAPRTPGERARGALPRGPGLLAAEGLRRGPRRRGSG